MKALAASLAVLAALTPLASATSRSAGTNAGIYTPEQAVQGARVYAVRCAMCHGAGLAGTVEVPGLTGKFMANWAGRPVGDLYDYLARAMPQMAPGSLTPEDNARLVAYLLQANGAPAGRSELPADSARLKRIMLQPVRHP
jgi:mono/diheme cytochrome c family protein